MNLDEKIAIIKALPLFESLTDSELEVIAAKLHEKNFPAHTAFIEQEDASDAAYILIEGSARVYRLTEDGEEVTLTIMGKGELVGEMSLLDDEPRSATVETLQDSRVLALTKEEFREILQNYPEIAIRILKTMSRRVRAANEQIEDVLFKNLEERTWKILQNLIHYFPNKDIALSQEELAGILGATRARVTEALNNLEKEGKITLSHRKIHVN